MSTVEHAVGKGNVEYIKTDGSKGKEEDVIPADESRLGREKRVIANAEFKVPTAGDKCRFRLICARPTEEYELALPRTGFAVVARRRGKTWTLSVFGSGDERWGRPQEQHHGHDAASLVADVPRLVRAFG